MIVSRAPQRDSILDGTNSDYEVMDKVMSHKKTPEKSSLENTEEELSLELRIFGADEIEDCEQVEQYIRSNRFQEVAPSCLKSTTRDESPGLLPVGLSPLLRQPESFSTTRQGRSRPLSICSIAASTSGDSYTSNEGRHTSYSSTSRSLASFDANATTPTSIEFSMDDLLAKESEDEDEGKDSDEEKNDDESYGERNANECKGEFLPACSLFVESERISSTHQKWTRPHAGYLFHR